MLVLMVMGLNAMPLYIFLSALNASSYANKLNSWNAWALLAGGLVFTIIAQIAALGLGIDEKKADMKVHVGQFLISPSLMTVGLIALGAWQNIEDNVMAVASVRVPRVTLAIAKSGCQALVTLKLAPALPASGPNSYESGCTLGPVTVLSRVGSRWSVKCIEPDLTMAGVALAIKGDDVLNFLAASPPIPAASAASAASAAPASQGLLRQSL